MDRCSVRHRLRRSDARPHHARPPGPAILLADEPTENLDTQTGEEILGLFADLTANDWTIILVTHEEEAERVVRVRDGLVEADE